MRSENINLQTTSVTLCLKAAIVPRWQPPASEFLISRVDEATTSSEWRMGPEIVRSDVERLEHYTGEFAWTEYDVTHDARCIWILIDQMHKEVIANRSSWQMEVNATKKKMHHVLRGGGGGIYIASFYLTALYNLIHPFTLTCWQKLLCKVQTHSHCAGDRTRSLLITGPPALPPETTWLHVFFLEPVPQVLRYEEKKGRNTTNRLSYLKGRRSVEDVSKQYEEVRLR